MAHSTPRQQEQRKQDGQEAPPQPHELTGAESPPGRACSPAERVLWALPREVNMADGGHVVCLILLMAAIGFAIFCTVAIYCAVTTKDSETRFKKQARCFAATANIGNAVTHILIAVYLLGNSSR